ASSRNRPAVTVQEALQERDSDVRGVVKVDAGDELRVRVGPRQSQLPKGCRNGLGDDHAAGVTVHLTEHVDAEQRRLRRGRQLVVPCRKAWSRLRGETPVAEQQAERVRVERNLLWLELGGGCKQRQLVALLMGSSKTPDHVSRREDTPRLPPTSLFRRETVPTGPAAANTGSPLPRAHPQH